MGLNNKELLALLEKEGFEVRSHSSTIEVEDADLIRKQIIAERQQKDSDNDAPAPDEEELEATEESEDSPEKAVAEEDLRELHLKTPTVRDLADALKKKPNELIGMLMTMNIFAAINQVLDVELVEKICERHGVKFIRERREKPQEKGAVRFERKAQDKTLPRKKVGRPPVVVFMGHVDHGKTSLQDYIRSTKVTAGESGGITQHIGASVAHVGDETITFLDTPGHAAFTAMRARRVAALRILRVGIAAPEELCLRQIERSITQSTNVPIVVAMNKMICGSESDKSILASTEWDQS